MVARTAKSKKAKGTKLEKYVAKEFERFGWKSQRQPGSGVYQDFPHDVRVESPAGSEYIIECKAWKHGWRTGEKAMGQAEILVIKKDYGEPMVYMPLAVLGEIIQEGDGI